MTNCTRDVPAKKAWLDSAKKRQWKALHWDVHWKSFMSLGRAGVFLRHGLSRTAGTVL